MDRNIYSDLCAVLKIYKANRIGLSILSCALILGVRSWLGIVNSSGHQDRYFVWIYSAVIVVIIPVLVWLLSLRVSIYEHGIISTSLFSKWKMRWDEVDRFYFHRVRHVLFLAYLVKIPIVKTCYFKLVNAAGQTLAFDSRFQRHYDLGQDLIEHTSRVGIRTIFGGNPSI